MVLKNISSTYLIDAFGGIYSHNLEDRQTVRLVDFSQTFTDIAITPNGKVFANTSRSIYDVDIENGTLVTVSTLFSSANGLASDAEGNLYIGYNSLSRIDVIDGDTFEFERSIALPSGTGSAGDIMVVGDTLYYTSSARNLLEVDLATDSVTSVVYHGLSAAYGLHELDETLYAFSGDDVYIIDRVTGVAELQYELIDAQFSSIVYGAATAPITRVEGTDGDDILVARFPGLLFDGGAGDDNIKGSNGTDTLVGGSGDDTIEGGQTTEDLRDMIFGGGGNDYINGGYGNDNLNGGLGRDTVDGGFGADTVIGNEGNDQLSGGALGDNLFGNAGDDFMNGGFGYDRVNGGDGTDTFYHLGVYNHGSDWIQDYDAAEGDVLRIGRNEATREQFQLNRANTEGAGVDGVDELFVVYRPTGQIIWALVDGDAQEEINLQIGGDVFDLMS